ncbi:MAG: 4Fe-4S binding protein [Anaerolineae bacterium]
MSQPLRLELTRNIFLKRLLRQRAFQWALMVPMLFFFVLAILTGLFGTPVGSRNFAIIFVWIVWWALVIILMVPLAGRLWCTMCPIPAPGEWLQRRALVTASARSPGKRTQLNRCSRCYARARCVRLPPTATTCVELEPAASACGKGRRALLTLGRRWPRRLRNIWLQNLAFLGVALFSAIILTRPLATGVILLAFVLLALGLSLVYERRVFCRYLCPVGGFIGLYAMVAPLELRVKDPEVCRHHQGRECYLGSEEGYGCPWMVFPGHLERNTYCGLCTECLKTCPQDNIALNLRPFGLDLLVPRGRRLDESYKAFIMLACALLYSVVLLGPWGWLKDWANLVALDRFLAYAALFLGVNLVLVPGLFFLTTLLARTVGGLKHIPLRRLFVDYSYALVPLGLMAWIAFSLSFVFVNGSYAVSVISDPFGWGWDLFGTAGYPWTPYLSQFVPYLQVPVLILGLLASIYVAYRIAQEHGAQEGQAVRGLIPVAVFLTGVTLAFLRLYLG